MRSTTKHQIGDSVGRYRLVREVGDGFPGPLWAVESSADGVAALGLARVYSFPDDIDQSIRESLGSSAWDAMEVDHVAVGKAADVVFEESEFATIYDYVDGLPLNALMRLAASRKAPFPSSVALRVACDVLAGLDALKACADTLGVSGVHGGLVPDACFVARQGRSVLLDAFVAGPAATYPALLRVKDRVGYVAPEQFQGLPADTRSDVYAVGCVLWELLANRRLHLGGVATVERNITRGQLLSLRAFASDETPGFEQLVAVVSRATHVDPAQRHPTPSALRDALESLPIGVAEPHEVARFVSALADLGAETGEEATASKSLRDALQAHRIGPSVSRVSRRNSAPPSVPEEPVPSSLESRVDFEIPPPFPPPEPPPRVVIEPLPQAPRVPDLALLDVIPGVSAPTNTPPVASPAASVASGVEGASRVGSREGSQSQSKVVPPSSPAHAIPRVQKKPEPTPSAGEQKSDAMKKALGLRSTLVGPSALSPRTGVSGGAMDTRSESKSSPQVDVPRPKITPVEIPKFSPGRVPAKPVELRGTGAPGKSPESPAVAPSQSPVLGSSGAAERASRNQTMMGLGAAEPRALVEGDVPAKSKDPSTKDVGVGSGLGGSVDATAVTPRPGPVSAAESGKSVASDDEATSISPPPILDDIDASDGPAVSARPVVAAVRSATLAPLANPKQLDAEMFATPAREAPGGGTTSPLTWIFGASTLGLSIVVVVLLMRTPEPPPIVPAPTSLGARALNQGAAVPSAVPSPVSPATAPAESANAVPPTPNAETALTSAGGANSAPDAVPTASVRPRPLTRRAAPASKGPKFVPVDL